VKPRVPENTEVYNIPSVGQQIERTHPVVLTKDWAAIEKFSSHIRDEIVARLFQLFAIELELPEVYFLDFHRNDEVNSSYMRDMKYHARTPEQNAALDNNWLKGHTVFGSLTLLFRHNR
jgi:isopenicillin N synthase-like dioxygenase